MRHLCAAEMKMLEKFEPKTDKDVYGDVDCTNEPVSRYVEYEG